MLDLGVSGHLRWGEDKGTPLPLLKKKKGKKKGVFAAK